MEIDKAIILNEHAVALFQEGKYQDAVRLFVQVLNINKRSLGESHPEYATSLNNLAVLYYKMGLYTEAEPLLVKALEVRKLVLGDNHPAYKTSLVLLASVYEGMVEYGKAEPLYRQALEITQREQGENHPDYASELSLLAALYEKMGLYAKAEPLLGQSLEIRKRVLGENHPDYARSLTSLATLYTKMTLYTKAEPLCTQALELLERILGKDDPTYAINLVLLASVYEGMILYGKAEPLYRQALEITKRAQGENHPDYATELYLLAALYDKMGLYTKAEPLLVQSLDIRKRVTGEETQEYAQCLNNLGVLYTKMKLFAKAEPFCTQALEVQERVLGKEHPAYAVGLNNLAWLYFAMGQHTKAEVLYFQALKLQERVSGMDDPAFARALMNLAILYSDLAQYGKAEPLYRQAEEITKRVQGQDHPDYAACLNNMAGLYYAMGQYAKAETWYLQAVDIRKRALGENHPDYAVSLNALANLYRSTGMYAKAEVLYFQVLDIRKRFLGGNHPDHAETLNNLAGLYADMHEYAKAEPLYVQTLDIWRRALGEDHADYATGLNNLAELDRAMGQNAKAEAQYLQALDILKRVFGEYHPRYAETLNNLALLYADMREYAKAEPLLLRVLEISQGALGENHPDFATCISNLAGVYVRMGLSAKAKPLLMQALKVRELTLGQGHPNTLVTTQSLVCLSALDEEPEALSYARQWLSGARSFLSHSLVGTTEARKQDILRTAGSIDGMYSFVLRKSPVPVEASRLGMEITLGLKGLVLEVMSAERSWGEHVGSAVWREKQQKLVRLRQELQGTMYGANDRPADKVRLEELEKKIDEAERELAGENLSFASQIKLRDAGLAEVMKALPQASALLEFVRYDVYDFHAKGEEPKWKPARYACIVLRQGDVDPVALDLGDAQAFDDTVGEYRKLEAEQAKDGQVDAAAEEELAELGRKLYGSVLLPIEKSVSLEKHLRLIVSPDGDLSLIPFEALVVSLEKQSIRYAGEKYTISYVTTGREVVTWGDPASPNAGPPEVIGAPDFDLNPEGVQVAMAKWRPAQQATGVQVAQLQTLGGASPENVLKAMGERGGHWSELPGADKYSEGLADALGIKRAWTGKDALEDVVKSLSSPRVLAFVTHGFYESALDSALDRSREWGGELLGDSARNSAMPAWKNPMLHSGLVFAGANVLGRSDELKGTQGEALNDGILTALEASGLELEGTELVSLTACETGLGQVETGLGVSGLRRAFMHAGARTLQVSMWQIPLDQSAEESHDFYTAWLTGKRPRNEAHRAASLKQLEDARNGQYQSGHPIFWAGIVLVGNPN